MIAVTQGWQRSALTLAFVAVTLAMWVHRGDVFSLPKLSLVVLAAIVCLAIGLIRVVVAREIVIPREPAVYAALAFFVALAVTTVVSPTPAQSFVGQYSQYGGFLSYASYVVVFLTVVRSHNERTVPPLLLAVVATTLVVCVYAMLQVFGLDPADDFERPQIVSTHGNPNFLAGWVGAALPVSLWATLSPRVHVVWRLAAAATAALTVPVAMEAESFQGPATVAAAVIAFAVLSVAGGGLAVPRLLRSRWVIGGAALLAVLASPAVFRAATDGVDQGLLERRHFWAAAAEAIADDPITGTGPDSFHNQFLSRRSAEHAGIPASKNAGAAHNVVLDQFVGGGLLLGLPYLAFVALVGWRLVSAVRKRPAEAALLAGVGAAWFAYQLQSMVSIDRPQLGLFHWLMAGLVLATVAPTTAVVELPGRDATHQPARRGRSVGTMSPASVVVAAAVVVVALGGAWLATQPFRADLAVASSRRALDRKDGARALQEARRARELAPWEATYTFDALRAAVSIGENAAALEAAEAGARLEAGDGSYALVAANVASAVGDTARARRWLDEALRRDPFGLDILFEASTQAAAQGDLPRAERLVRRMLHVSDTRPDVWLQVGKVRASIGDSRGAWEAYRRALDFDPGNDEAEKGLEELGR